MTLHSFYKLVFMGQINFLGMKYHYYHYNTSSICHILLSEVCTLQMELSLKKWGLLLIDYICMLSYLIVGNELTYCKVNNEADFQSDKTVTQFNKLNQITQTLLHFIKEVVSIINMRAFYYIHLLIYG